MIKILEKNHVEVGEAVAGIWMAYVALWDFEQAIAAAKGDVKVMRRMDFQKITC